MPEFAIDPCDSRDEAIGFDGAKHRACLRIDLMNLSRSILTHPKKSFRPRQPRVTAAGCGDCGEHSAGLWIDLLNAIFGDLEQMLTVERRSCMRSHINRAQRLAARGIESIQPVSRCKPDILTVITDAVHAVGAWERAILPDDFSVGSFHDFHFNRSAMEQGVTKSS